MIKLGRQWDVQMRKEQIRTSRILILMTEETMVPSKETQQARKEWNDILKIFKDKNCQLYHSDMKEK